MNWRTEALRSDINGAINRATKGPGWMKRTLPEIEDGSPGLVGIDGSERNGPDPEPWKSWREGVES